MIAVQLPVVPVAADCGHQASALAEHPDDRLAILDAVCPRKPRPVGALAVEPVALRARPLPELLTERRRAVGLLRAPLLEPGVELRGRQHLGGRGHLRVVDAAELGALPGEDAGALGPEPRLVDGAGDRVDLAAERGDPPRVDHVPVGRRHAQLDRASLGDAEPVDRDHAVRVAVLPHELRALDVDDEVLLPAGRGGHVLDPGELHEDERRDPDEKQRRARPSRRARARSSRGSARRRRRADGCGAGSGSRRRRGGPRRSGRSRGRSSRRA